jgi:uncharacterized protein YkwD
LTPPGILGRDRFRIGPEKPRSAARQTSALALRVAQFTVAHRPRPCPVEPIAHPGSPTPHFRAVHPPSLRPVRGVRERGGTSLARFSQRRPEGVPQGLEGPVRVPTQVTPQISAPPAYWGPEELGYVDLINCTRTGGWVQTDGTCKGRGSGRYSAYVPPLAFNSRMSAVVARPYAKKLADNNVCSHFYTSTPTQRLHAAGYYPNNWAENIGCRTSRYAWPAVIASHLFFQSEKTTNGGHWRNIKNPAFKQVGIGVWKTSGRVRLVTDFTPW